MCGIAGIVNVPVREPDPLTRITAMISAFRYRGPDQSGVYLDDDAALGHARLSIIGIDSGIQPISNETGTLWIVYNGEAFNYIELKAGLVAKGHRFTTETDTEVLLHLYEEYGPASLEMINGQFAFAIWDSVKKELFLARDRVGIRPLYYSLWGGGLIFASEIKAITAVDGPRGLDLEALSQVFVFWSTLPGRTVFKGIRELPPGHYMIYRAGETLDRPYWQIPFHPLQHPSFTFEEAAEHLRELLADAVRLRLRADVPVGAYLSGGLDSSIISMLISRLGKTHLKTFSLGFEAGGFDETPFQQELVDYLETDNRRVTIGNGEIRSLFPQTVWHCEKPLLRTSPVPMFILSRLVRSEGYKVVLSGEGADEILGGYNIYKEAKIRQYWGRHPASVRRPLLLQRLYPYIFTNPSRGGAFLQEFFAVKPEELDDPFFSHRVRWEGGRRNLGFLSEECNAALSSYDPFDELATLLPASFWHRDPLARAQVLEMEIFLANFLLSSQGDRVGMANSIEMRHPFLDYRVIDFSFRLPASWKIRALNEKYLLKRAFKGMIPERITHRPKQPYRAPIRELFVPGAPIDYVDDLLSEESLRGTGYFNAKKISRLYAKFRQAGAEFSSEFQNMALVGALSTQLLHRQFVAHDSQRPVVPVAPDRVVYGNAIAKGGLRHGSFSRSGSP
ncbi:asparagine synthase (glutamine-hydrolyzing) [Geomonas sp. Red32]|uniref:asparagine synthase (glutamine-hydrolyzing) n=1 Tax=Geomonas sp. Red32 TaxID=2912856 RepID=UPI00202CE800|nr:asparagine synthase (glutamine-hydrolyzing) [Geomonas sp. Red32]MCM0082100.1 asparagine synthase (glutamine-hydrolyzing) [Geomonas sp. Red32]